ncbi:V4R domain-containing protein [Roseofilum capinflatum]|uniref:4-vinyl reductase n=1 Tax=Roseofilum capinflatum BLCC-M114 TaxID=3022440 RepID=A0ABT7B2Z5_9CYAN|nr:V4R domain-containing protein [Roseofilum capinflatum]MDJ1173014.1 4-vinyl reductase [Roseofilum capinflatum BLCC-M114]
MISVSDLVTNNRIPSNYFASDVYVRSDLELGLLENRRGDRLLAMPEPLIQAIYSGLDKETGQASKLVLYNCGRWWGKNFYARFAEEVSEYYEKSLADMSMLDFLQSFKQCWKTHGWGKIELDQSYISQGFLVVKTWNAPFAAHSPKLGVPVCFLDAGVFSAFFSQLSGKDLYCVQSACESLGAECNHFILGLEKRLSQVEDLVGEKTHAEIMQQLTTA